MLKLPIFYVIIVSECLLGGKRTYKQTQKRPSEKYADTKGMMRPSYSANSRQEKQPTKVKLTKKLTEGNQKFSIAFPLIRRKGKDARQVIWFFRMLFLHHQAKSKYKLAFQNNTKRSLNSQLKLSTANHDWSLKFLN